MPHAKFSTNGSTWTTATFSGGTISGNFVNIENTNYIWGALTSSGQIWKSDQKVDNLGQFNISSSYPSNILQMSSLNNDFISVISEGYFSSKTLENWTQFSLLWTTVSLNYLNSGNIVMFYGNDGNWIVNQSRYNGINAYENATRSSTNGLTWTTVTSNFGSQPFITIFHENSLWIAGGYSGQMRNSNDSILWNTVTSNFGNTAIRSISYGNGLWVAGGDAGQIRTSIDGNIWTTNTSNFAVTISSIAYGNGLWAVGGYSVNITTSSNPIETLNIKKFIKSQDEQKRAFLNDNGIIFNWNDISYERISTGINDNFVNGAIRNNSGTYEYVIQGNNAMYHSTNLTGWTTISQPPTSTINDIISVS